MAEVYYRVSKDDLNEIYKFHYNYTADKRTQYIWDWEYGNSNPNNSLLLAVKDSGKVIATQGMISIKIAFSKEIYTTGKNESLLIENEYRGKNLSTRLYNYAINEYEKEGISFLWGFSRKAIIPLKKANFRIFEGVMKRMVLSTNIKQAQEVISKKSSKGIKVITLRFIILLASLYSSLIFRLSNIFKTTCSENVEIIQELKNSNDIINLYEKLLSKYPELIYIYQDKDYYNWRIMKSPYPIRTLFLYKNEELLGYLYLKIQDKFCEITDFTYTDVKYGKRLFKELTQTIAHNNYGFIYYTGNKNNKLNKSVFKLLRCYGFLKMKGPNHFVLRNFNFKNIDKLLKIENWYINDLWSEGI